MAAKGKAKKKTNKKVTLVELIKNRAPEEPDLTCPDINSLQDLLEKLRTSNSELRSAAEYWRKIAVTLCEHVPTEDKKLIMKYFANSDDESSPQWDWINNWRS
ncbi:MAG: hypothetical protein FJ187_09775 [Gammaproteobacteria bacterium]|nr:hypothetical protein [Gammaproteobacteria bacterium]